MQFQVAPPPGFGPPRAAPQPSSKVDEAPVSAAVTPPTVAPEAFSAPLPASGPTENGSSGVKAVVPGQSSLSAALLAPPLAAAAVSEKAAAVVRPAAAAFRDSETAAAAADEAAGGSAKTPARTRSRFTFAQEEEKPAAAAQPPPAPFLIKTPDAVAVPAPAPVSTMPIGSPDPSSFFRALGIPNVHVSSSSPAASPRAGPFMEPRSAPFSVPMAAPAPFVRPAYEPPLGGGGRPLAPPPRGPPASVNQQQRMQGLPGEPFLDPAIMSSARALGGGPDHPPGLQQNGGRYGAGGMGISNGGLAGGNGGLGNGGLGAGNGLGNGVAAGSPQRMMPQRGGLQPPGFGQPLAPPPQRMMPGRPPVPGFNGLGQPQFYGSPLGPRQPPPMGAGSPGGWGLYNGGLEQYANGSVGSGGSSAGIPVPPRHYQGRGGMGSGSPSPAENKQLLTPRGMNGRSMQEFKVITGSS